MKIGNLVVTDGYHDEVGIVLFVEATNEVGENWCRVRWADGQITWETQDDLGVIA